MPQPPPPVEGCIRAWELYGQHYPWTHVAELLRKEGYKCGSYETARQWGHKGRDLAYTKDALDRGGGRARMVSGLEQDMASLRELVRVSDGEHLLDVMPHLKWMYRELARLIGTDAPTQTELSVTGDVGALVPDAQTAAQLEAATRQAEADVAALRNGR